MILKLCWELPHAEWDPRRQMSDRVCMSHYYLFDCYRSWFDSLGNNIFQSCRLDQHKKSLLKKNVKILTQNNIFNLCKLLSLP